MASVYPSRILASADRIGSVTGNSTYPPSQSSTAATTVPSGNVSLGQCKVPVTNVFKCDQYFLTFDTSTIPAGVTSIVLSLNSSSASANQNQPDFYEVRVASSDANMIAGDSLGSLPLVGSGTAVVMAMEVGRVTFLLDTPANLPRAAGTILVIHSRGQRTNTAPTVAGTQAQISPLAGGAATQAFLEVAGPWSLVGLSSVVEVTTTAHALTEPAGVASGDLLIACIASRIASTSPVILPSGWTSVGAQTNNNTATNTSALPSAQMAYIVRGASAPPLTFTHQVAPSVAIGRIIAYRGNTATPYDVAMQATTATNTTAVSVAGLTTTQDDDLIVAMTAGGQEATWSSFAAVTDPTRASGMDATTTPPIPTWQQRADTNTLTGADTSLGIFDAVKPTAGATGNLTVTASQAAGHCVIAGAFKTAASPNVTASVNGQSVATAVGSVTVTAVNPVTVPVNGQAIAAAVGAVTASGVSPVTVSVGGLELGVSVGHVSVPVAAPPSREYAVLGPFGAVFVSDQGQRDYSLTPVFLSERPLGAAAVPVTVPVNGQAVATAIGSASAVGAASIAVSGQAVAVASGSVTASAKITAPVSGQALGTAVGTTTATGAAATAVNGQAVSVSVGSVTVAANAPVSVSGQVLGTAVGSVTTVGKANVTVAGQAIAAFVGNVSVSAGGAQTVGLTSQTLSVAVGSVSVTGKAAPIVVAGQALGVSVGGVSVTAGVSVTVPVNGQALSVQVGSVTVTTGAVEPPVTGGGGGIYWKPSGAHVPKKELKKAVRELLEREKKKPQEKRKRPAALAKELVRGIAALAPGGLGALEKKALAAFLREGLLALFPQYFIPAKIHDRTAIENALLHLQLEAIERLRAEIEEEDEEAVMLLLAAA